jgi:hypothetical protein
MCQDLEAVISAAEEADGVSDVLARLLEREGPCVLNARGGKRRWTALMAAGSKGHMQVSMVPSINLSLVRQSCENSPV